MNTKKVKACIKLNIFFAVGMALLYCLYCFALVPLGNMYANNIQYMETVLPTVVEYIYDLVEIIAIALAYAVSIYSIYNYSTDTVRIGIPAIIFSNVTLFKYLSNLLMTWFDNGFEIKVWSDIRSILVPLFFELLQYFVVLLIAHKILSKHFERIEEKRKAAKKLGREESGDGVYPFKFFLNLGNPMLRTAFWAGVIVAITKVAQRILYDVIYTIMWGVPQLSEILGMIIYYSSDVLCGVACYFVVIWLLMLFFEKKLKREIYE